MSEIKLKLWDNTERTFECGKPIVILGANGAGKTRLSVLIEELNDSRSKTVSKTGQLVHRISAQKSLSIRKDMLIKGIEVSEEEVFRGTIHSNTKFQTRFNGNPYTSLLSDYDKVLSLLFTKSTMVLELAHREGTSHGLVTLTQQVESIWNSLLPMRKLELVGNEVHAVGGNKYHGADMSDGERVMLYFIAQVLTLKENSVLIVDEPELHIHKAIVNQFWNKLEQSRPDCLFIYITHDLDFAVSRNTSEIVWVKSFDGMNTWETEFLSFSDYDDLPTALVYEMIGTRKKIIFVEGTKDSLDYLLYQELYGDEDFHIIPCGGCTEVIRCVKAKKGYAKFNNIITYGIIDRDFRTDNEIASLQENGIFCLEVAEVENLFIVPELLDLMSAQLGCDAGTPQVAKDFISRMYSNKMNKQVEEAFRKEIDFQLSNERLDETDNSVEAITNKILTKFTSDFISQKFQIEYDKFSLIDSSSTSSILKVFNYKGLVENIGHCFNIERNNTPYTTRVLNFLKSNDTNTRDKIITAIKPYLPNLPNE